MPQAIDTVHASPVAAANCDNSDNRPQSSVGDNDPFHLGQSPPTSSPQLFGNTPSPTWVRSSKGSASTGSIATSVDRQPSLGSYNQPQPKRRWRAANSSDSIMAGVWEMIASTHQVPELSGRGQSSATHQTAQTSGLYQSPLVVVDKKSKWPGTSLRMALLTSCAILVLVSNLGLLILQEVLIAKGMRDKDEFGDFATVARIIGICMSCLAVLLSMIIAVSLGNTITSPLSEMREQMVNLGNAVVHTETMKQRRSPLLELAKIQDAFGRLTTSVSCFCAYVPNTIVRGVLAGEDRAMRLHVSQRK
eukprot:4143401-Amphidinium_carterae.1